MGHDPAELGELERSILMIVWRVGSVTAEQVREELGRPLKDSTIRTVLRRLEEKGYLAHEVENRTFLYRPAQSQQRVAGRAVKRIVDWFCDGSVEALLVGLVDSKVLDRAELQRLAERIAVAQKSAEAGNHDLSIGGSRFAGAAGGPGSLGRTRRPADGQCAGAEGGLGPGAGSRSGNAVGDALARIAGRTRRGGTRVSMASDATEVG